MRINIKFELHVFINKESKKDVRQNEVESRRDHTICKPFFQLASEKIIRMSDTLSKATINNYQTALRSLHRFLGNDIQAENIDADLIKTFERWLRERHLNLNTVSCYMRSLRSLMSKMGLVEQAKAFDGVFTGKTKTDKRAISETDISALKAIMLQPGTTLCLFRDIFLFSFYALGMPFVDIAFLRKSQIQNGEIVYYRHKTGQRVNIALEPCMLEIIRRYQNNKRDYVFPLLHCDEPEKAYDEYLKMLNRYNRALKKLSKMIHLDSRLTSYTARHTWASVAYSKNVELPVISKALGHTNPQTTLIYVKEINDRRLSQANHEILNTIQNS